MIADRLENAGLYAAAGTRLAKAFAHLKKLLAALPPDGKIELEGKDIFALVQSYETRPAAEKTWEAHRDYIDIQHVADGREILEWAPAGRLSPAGTYNPEKDVVFFQEAEGVPVRLAAGEFVVFFPNDAHRPQCAWGPPAKVRKVVIKVRR
ncbi:MAG: YhcH/YjgK/YiaL family protein [Planctomycetota bacterium]